MDNINEDFMSKVMNRRLGGGTSSCESSPDKRQLMSAETGTLVKINLTNNSNLNSALTTAGSPVSANVKELEGTVEIELEGTDEIDGFTGYGTEKVDINFGGKDPDKLTESTKDADIAVNSNDFQQAVKENKFGCLSTVKNTNNENPRYNASQILENLERKITTKQQNEEFNTSDNGNVKNNHVRYEYVLSGEKASATTELRIELFNESDSNSGSNPFILTSFQSLNTNHNEGTAEKTLRNEANKEIQNDKLDMKTDITVNLSAENSQKLGWKMANTVYDSNFESLPHKPNEKDNESAAESDSNECNKGRMKSETLRSGKYVVKEESEKESLISFNLKSVIQHERSENENKLEYAGLHMYKITRENITSKRSETELNEEKTQGRKDNGRNNEILKENKIYNTKSREANIEIVDSNDSESTNQSEDEVKVVRINETSHVIKECVNKCIAKKSRKQNVPKRVRKIDLTEDNESDCGLEMEDFEGNKNIDEYGSKQTDSAGQESIAHFIIESSVGSPKVEATEQKKSEKSRKQCKPKRIDQSQEVNDQTPVFGNDNEEAGFHGSDNDIVDDKGVNYDYLKRMENEQLYELNVTSDDSDQKDNRAALEVNVERDGDSAIQCFRTNETVETKPFSESFQSTCNESNRNLFTSLNTSPFYYGFSPNLDLISSITPGLLKGASSSTGSFALNESGQENLEVIRQLREIRCNRYRKISMAEKREIAGYASAHGVSQAAAYYNVSKSAVSMWTKLDFSNANEDTGRQKKNCMIGNEKFEALCQKVKNERENKFKGMTKQDKFEVSRYAKLVGVREMARCLDVALGTVSGWMRQFPYKVETETSDTQLTDESNSKTNSHTNEDNEMNENKKFEEQSGNSQKRKNSDGDLKNRKKKRKSKADANDTYRYKTVQKDNTMYILPVGKTELSDVELATDENDVKNTDEKPEHVKAECDADESLQQKDELDKMIAETWQKPDFEKCFEDIKDMIKDSPLEGDNFFRSLFERVIACRADKYKTLKPSEKLEVVRYAKRVGVRKVAKILGLATGTLSGWNTKYQSSLSITDPNIDMSNKSDLLVSYLSPDKNQESVDSSSASQKLVMSPAASLDNNEKSEVTAVKLLFKDKFPVLLEKIGIAKQVKFRNITTEEKIEFVKCSKLVGIRPTARVFNIPIGTLSGWITKYTKTLHPAYNVDIDHDTSSNSQDGSSQFSPLGIYNPNVVGRTPAPVQMFQGLMNVNPAWQQSIPGFTPGGQVTSQNLFPQFPNMLSSSSSSVSSSLPFSSLSSELFSSPLFTSKNESESLEHSRESANGKEFETEENKHELTSHSKTSNHLQSNNVNIEWNSSEIEKQSSSSTVIKSEPRDAMSDREDDFEKEAKLMAHRYLTETCDRMGIPIV